MPRRRPNAIELILKPFEKQALDELTAAMNRADLNGTVNSAASFIAIQLTRGIAREFTRPVRVKRRRRR